MTKISANVKEKFGIQTEALVATERSSGIVDAILPCGLLDVENQKLHQDAVVREICGPEEDLLAADMDETTKTDMLIAACTVSIGPYSGNELKSKLPDLLEGDRIALLLRIRTASHGPTYPFVFTCPREDCQHSDIYDVNLDTLDKKSMVFEAYGDHRVELPSGKVVVWRPMDGRASRELSAMLKTNVEFRNQFKENKMTAYLLSRLVEVDGASANLDNVRAITSRDRDFLRAQIDDLEGGIDTTVQIECSGKKCQGRKEMDVELNIGQGGFFFPLAQRAKWKRKRNS